jgi:hypothetical protein
MAWEEAINRLYGLASGLTGALENRKVSIEEAAQLPAVQALREQLTSWFKQPSNVEGLIEASERARREHRELVMRIKAKRARGAVCTPVEMDQLMLLWEADTTLSKEALGKAAETSEILHFTATQLMPWLKLAVRLSLIPVKDQRLKEIASTALSFAEPTDVGTEQPSLDQLEEAVVQALSGERPLCEISARYGVRPAQLIRAAARYGDAGRATLQHA